MPTLKHGSTTISTPKHGSTTLIRVYHGDTLVFGTAPVHTKHTVIVTATTGNFGYTDPFGTTIYEGTGSYSVANADTVSISPKTASTAEIVSTNALQINYKVGGPRPSTSYSATLTYWTYD